MHSMCSKKRYPLQSGFRASHFTETALAEKTNNLHVTKSNGQCTISSHLASQWYLKAHPFLTLLLLLVTLPSLGSCDISSFWFSSYLGSSSFQSHFWIVLFFVGSMDCLKFSFLLYQICDIIQGQSFQYHVYASVPKLEYAAQTAPGFQTPVSNHKLNISMKLAHVAQTVPALSLLFSLDVNSITLVVQAKSTWSHSDSSFLSHHLAIRKSQGSSFHTDGSQSLPTPSASCTFI